jgi:hypothetical protein
MIKKKFQDSGETIFSFLDDLLVICSQCKSCAEVIRVDANDLSWNAPRRLVCNQCGLIGTWAKNSMCVGGADPVDPFFGLPLFFNASCCGHTLWAYNLKHLNLIEDYVGAELRAHTQNEEFGWSNKGLVNFLPQWMTSSKNRDSILKVITKLKRKLLTSP